MAENIEPTIERLLAAKDGAKAFRDAEKLLREFEKGSHEAKAGLTRYLRTGRMGHVREHIASELAERAEEGDAELAEVFREGLDDEDACFWCVQGLVQTMGREAYPRIAAIALDDDAELEVRAQAIKCLAQHSGQPFDRGPDDDPGAWSDEELRIQEVAAWTKAGYPSGQGHAEPERHPALDRPKTEFEKVVARLEKRLARLRAESQDLAQPSNWLTPADPADLKAIQKKWKLPKTYLDFLTRFSPLNVNLPESKKKFARQIHLYGAAELIAGQIGYAVHGKTGKPIKDWPASYVVIASLAGDPYVLDLSGSDGDDAPVAFAEHGQGSWDFHLEADSFQDFLAALAKR